MKLLRLPMLLVLLVSSAGCNEITTPTDPNNEPPRIDAPETVYVNLGSAVHFFVVATDADDEAVGLTVTVVTSRQERLSGIVPGRTSLAFTVPWLSDEIAVAAMVGFQPSEADVPERSLRIVAQDGLGARSVVLVRVVVRDRAGT